MAPDQEGRLLSHRFLIVAVLWRIKERVRSSLVFRWKLNGFRDRQVTLVHFNIAGESKKLEVLAFKI